MDSELYPSDAFSSNNFEKGIFEESKESTAQLQTLLGSGHSDGNGFIQQSARDMLTAGRALHTKLDYGGTQVTLENPTRSISHDNQVFDSKHNNPPYD